MRIILDTDKRTITVPWNYQKKLDDINKVIMEATGDKKKQKTFTGFIDDIWKEAITVPANNACQIRAGVV